MKLKLFNKYFFTTSVIIVFSLTMIMIILSFVLNNHITNTKQNTLTIACEEIGEYVTESYEKSEAITEPEFFTMLNSVSNVAEADLFIADTTGKVFACGCGEWQENGRCVHSTKLLPKNEIDKGLNNADRMYLSTLSIYQKPHYVSVKAIKNDSDVHYATVVATAPVSLVTNLLWAVTKLFLASAFLPLVLMFIFIYAMTYRLTKPLKLMSQASKAMAKGDFSKRIPVMSDDEIGELSISFNMMTNSLSQLEGMRKSFVANVSHELRTPMTTISGFIDGILDGTIDPEKHEYYLKIVSSEIKRLSRIVESMLNMSKIESKEFNLNRELIDFKELLCKIVINQEQRIVSKNLDITGLDTAPDVSLNVDRDLMHQVIYNLVDNAVKFNRQNGYISFDLLKANKNLIFTIKNSGDGIPEKDLPFVFERFYKVDKARSDSKNGTGLGLYITKAIVTAHSGTISVTSKHGEYTAFKITLPVL